jgi:hypothetical protein
MIQIVRRKETIIFSSMFERNRYVLRLNGGATDVVLSLFISMLPQLLTPPMIYPQQQMSRQDEGLEMLAQSAQRLGLMSNTITEELDYQNKMLVDMESDLDTATDNLDMVTRKTREMIKKAGGKQNFMIIVSLIGVTLVLIYLILI